MTGQHTDDEQTQIKFADDLIPAIHNGEKTATVRYDGYGDVRVGDELTAVTTEESPFAELTITRTASVAAVEAHNILQELGANYPSETPQDVIDALNTHYTGVNPRTIVNVLVFKATSR